ncbi:hypothetical protein [Clavibacter michiganensis]|uniref:hypothetical protein n=1 Tax=Clavibacter michiganensis TaxID=28447 RepID=UPI0026DC90CB|nr:hypothetical protein [Clavibacter michiganensis]MDO4073419.1 hypothetical protein [Clavibacter michiganensis]
MSKVKSKLDGIDSLVRSTGQHPWAHLQAGYWRIQVEDRPVVGYVIRHRAELGAGSPSTFTPTPATTRASASGSAASPRWTRPWRGWCSTAPS